MRAIITIEWGRLRGRKVLIEPGKTLRVGRLERADLVVPHDEQLSGLHFEMSWDGATCHLYDLGSANGTWLNGEYVTEGAVAHMDWVRAGDTFFSVYFEGVLPPNVADEGSVPEPESMPASRKAEALAALRAEVEPLFAVLDAARDKRILQLLRSAAEESQSLYEGAEGEELSEGAPYLVALPKGSQLLERLVKEGWGKGWGIYLLSRRLFKEVRRQLRRLLLVREDATGDELYFRFYDPRVLSAVVPVLKPRQLCALFSDVRVFLIEGEGAEVTRLSAP
jgi:Domain of unknown function (DUF4123)/FHA domain